MSVWLNGPCGVGKTTVARRRLAADPRLRLFDPETVGYLAARRVMVAMPRHPI